MDKLFAGKCDYRKNDWLECLNDAEIRFRVQHIKYHFCDSQVCNDVTARLRLRLREYQQRQDALFHPYHEAENDMALIKELQTLLRQAFETSGAEFEKLQLKY